MKRASPLLFMAALQKVIKNGAFCSAAIYFIYLSAEAEVKEDFAVRW